MALIDRLILGLLAVLRERRIVADDARAFDSHLVTEGLELTGVHVPQRTLTGPRFDPVERLSDLSVVSKALDSSEEERPDSLIHGRVRSHVPQVVVNYFTDPLRVFSRASCSESKTSVYEEKDQAYEK